MRISLQLFFIGAVYFSFRAWQLRDAVSGPAPAIEGQLTTGEGIRLSDYRGRPVLVHFWATWCPTCRFENAGIDAIANDHAVISVASWSEGAAEVRQFMRQEELDMPVIVDENGELARLYGVRGVPASYLVDKNGIIRFVESGFTTETGLRLRLWWLEN